MPSPFKIKLVAPHMYSPPKHYYIPKHAHAKAIAYYMRAHKANSYPLGEVNGMNGNILRYTERKRLVTGLRVYFIRYSHGQSSALHFERTH